MALVTSIKLAVLANLSAALDLASRKSDVNFNKSFAFADGVGADQANQIFSDTRTLAASANEEIDFGAVLTDALGASVVFTKVKALIVAAAAGNTNDVLVGGAAANGFITPFGDPTDVIKVKPGGAFALVAPNLAGYAVTSGTGDLLKIANSGGTTGVTYDIIVVGVQ